MARPMPEITRGARRPLDLRAPLPLPTRSPRWMEQQEHLCALWLAWGAAAQGLNQGTDRLSMG